MKAIYVALGFVLGVATTLLAGWWWNRSEGEMEISLPTRSTAGYTVTWS